MPVFQKPAARLRAWLFPADDVTFTVRTSARIARFIIPDIERLIRDDRVGETYRCAIAQWARWEAPPLALYQGAISLCRIHGPLLADGAGYRPAGGRIETSGFETNLTSEEADNVDRRIRNGIERAIRGWAEERQHHQHQVNQGEPPQGYNVTSAAKGGTSQPGQFEPREPEAPQRKARKPRTLRLQNKGGEDA